MMSFSLKQTAVTLESLDRLARAVGKQVRIECA
jgi:hypothetical protein